MIISRAIAADAEEILSLQWVAFRSQAEIYGDFSIPPLTQTLEQLKGDFAHKVFLKATVEERLVGSVRGIQTDQTCLVERLIVHPDYRGRGIGDRCIGGTGILPVSWGMTGKMPVPPIPK